MWIITVRDLKTKEIAGYASCLLQSSGMSGLRSLSSWEHLQIEFIVLRLRLHLDFCCVSEKGLLSGGYSLWLGKSICGANQFYIKIKYSVHSSHRLYLRRSEVLIDNTVWGGGGECPWGFAEVKTDKSVLTGWKQLPRGGPWGKLGRGNIIFLRSLLDTLHVSLSQSFHVMLTVGTFWTFNSVNFLHMRNPSQ